MGVESILKHLDDGDEAERLMRRFYPLIIESAFGDASLAGIPVAFDLENELIQDLLEELALQVRNIAETTRDEIRALIGKQASEGWSVERLGKEIRDRSITTSRSRGLTIARTETGTAYNRASIVAYRNGGLTHVTVMDGDGDGPCATANGSRWTLDYADAHPLEHPNCVRAFAPIVEDIITDATDSDADQAIPFDSDESGHEWASDVFSGQRNSMTDGEIASLENYAQKGYKKLNAALRSGEKLTADQQALLDDINNMMARGQTDKPIVAYRAMTAESIVTAFDSGELIGSTLTDNAIMSTSIGPGTANTFTHRQGKNPILFEIRIPSGTNAVYVETISELTEFELLLGTGTQLRVISTSVNDDGLRSVVCEVVRDT